MEDVLRQAITYDRGFRPTQVLIPSDVPCCLTKEMVPVVDITKNTCHLNLGLPEPIPHQDATMTLASKLLAGPTRNAALSSVALRHAHQKAGHFLAINHISAIIGLETYGIAHVNGGITTADRFLHEDRTTILAVMRAGEPLAFGISDAMPKAMFVHAERPQDLKLAHISGQYNIILADFVINTRETVIEFIEHIRSIHATIRIIVVAGVVQEKFISEGDLDKFAYVRLVTLRVSKNSYKGKGGSDTGHRLFNTTHMD